MRILHTADWHLGKKLEHYTRIEEQKEVLEEICTIANEEQVDMIIIAGDLYDKINPSTESQKLLFKTLKRLTNNGSRPVIAIAGNHDSPELFEAPDPLALECGIFLAAYPESEIPCLKLDSGVEILNSDKGFIELKLPKYDFPVRMILTPYANEYRLKKLIAKDEKEQGLREIIAHQWNQLAEKYCDNKGVNLLTAHLFVMKEGSKPEEEPEGEKPIMIGGASAIYTSLIPPQIQYTALGHLHRYQEIKGADCPVVYSSSPLAYSFAEANQVKKVVIIEVTPESKAELKAIDLKKGKKLLRNFKLKSVSEAINWLNENQDALVEIQIQKDAYLTGEEFQLLKHHHKGIVHIIPPDLNSESAKKNQQHIDLNKDINTLFEEYFEFRNNGQTLNEDLRNIFSEIQSLKSK